ncbi:FecR family protein [Pedobacter sp. G11]|uniref:FecR family protein n=1 Tax=Pedobacter sp. G11 TaxID=2482728 RepID=UPI000F602339|nr:FecR family protein [Pedobacter sp. G11]AZI24145.1 FecR family protein [Pedobacter sp. G11]
MDYEQARQLLEKYNSGKCTDAEKTLIEQSFLAFNEQPVEISSAKLKALKKQVSRDLPIPKSRSLKVIITISTAAAAAAIVFAIYMFNRQPENDIKRSFRIAEHIYPTGNSARITLSNGKTIELDQNHDEIKIENSGLSYSDGIKIKNNPTVEYQTISTSKGGEYKIVLSDGTKVWLNAATVLQYPTSFGEKIERRVKLVSGEAYFEVAKDKNHPFIVSSKNQNLTVLGTHFNINTYNNEVSTTLLEGSVKLNSKDDVASITLKPGERSIADGTSFRRTDVDLDLTLAWRNCKIKFRDADLKSILNEAERWYDIKVEYEDNVPNMRLTGGISRKSNLSVLLKLLQMSGVNFSLNEKQGTRILTIKSNTP